MATLDEVETDIGKIFTATWNIRDGEVVPKTEDVALSNGAVKLEAVLLYADLAASTKLARQFSKTMVAKVVRAYLSSMTRLINDAGGSVRSFDGDRVMGVFVGNSKNSNAANCALRMNYVVTRVLRPKAEDQFSSLKTKGFTIAHCAGLHRSEVLVVRGGVRGSNDLIFVGSAPNLAAKLSDIRNSPWHTYITHAVYGRLNANAKFGSDGRNMWTFVKLKIGDETWDCYKSTWWRTP